MWHVLVVALVGLMFQILSFGGKKLSTGRARFATVGIRSNVVFVQLLPGATTHNSQQEVGRQLD